MAMDAKQKKTLMIRVGAAVIVVIALAFLGYFLFWPSEDDQPKQSQLGPSDTMVPAKPQEIAASPGGQLIVTPENMTFVPDKPDTIVFTLRAVGAPVTLNNAVIPTTDTDVLQFANVDCPKPPQQLAAGSACSATVTWNGTRTVNSVIRIDASTVDTGGATVSTPQNVAVTAVSTRPGGAQVGQLPGQPSAVPPPVDPVAAVQQVPAGPNPTQQARDFYLQGRRGAPISVANAQLQAAARSPYTSWDNVGVQGTRSSFPVDMSRVITPDKPLTAVLTYNIDTRATVTAVAMVDRDVYGGNGRTVVIPRGSKLIGDVGGGSVDRVGVAWKQIIRPDGVRFLFEGASGDASGRGGLPGRINNRYLQRYGFSLLPTFTAAALTAALGGQSSQQNNNSGTSQTQDARAVAAQILQQPLQTISQDLFQKNSQIPVQISIPAGTRLTVWSIGDLRLKPVGEEDRAENDRTQAAAQQQGFSTPAAVQRSEPGAQQQQQQAPVQQQQYRPQPQPQSQNGGQEQGSALQVGRVDANGNYVAPGSSAPPPGPIATNPSGALQGATPQNGQAARAPGTTFPANSNPWQR